MPESGLTETRPSAVICTKKVETDQAGHIEGGFDLDNQAECPVVVEVTLIVPSGMSISGGNDWGDTGSMVSTELTIAPDGSDVKGVAANVYSETAGEHAVHAEIEYWPEGHPDMSQELDSNHFVFQVEEPGTQPVLMRKNN